MNSPGYFDRIGDEWKERAPELGQWAMTHLVNRTDVWGRYIKQKKKGKERNNAITAPFRDERGKVFLDVSSLTKHFRRKEAGGQLGIHAMSTDMTSRWLGIDIDLHDEQNLSVTPEGNFVAAKAWSEELTKRGFDPILFDSNGKGGFHIWILFAVPMSTASVHKFGKELVSDFEMKGLDVMPELFPGKPCWNSKGGWLRLPGRHHTREHYARVFEDEPWADTVWLEGHDAIDRILRTRAASLEVAKANGMELLRRTVCIDFDGCIHSYESGWCGAEVIPDPPIHRVKDAIDRLRENFRIVVHSARSATIEGHDAIIAWLQKHEIEVDEVSRYKPPASIYIDDRAIHYRGNWDDTIAEGYQFRK